MLLKLLEAGSMILKIEKRGIDDTFAFHGLINLLC